MANIHATACNREKNRSYCLTRGRVEDPNTVLRGQFVGETATEDKPEILRPRRRSGKRDSELENSPIVTACGGKKLCTMGLQRVRIGNKEDAGETSGNGKHDEQRRCWGDKQEQGTRQTENMLVRRTGIRDTMHGENDGERGKWRRGEKRRGLLLRISCRSQSRKRAKTVGGARSRVREIADRDYLWWMAGDERCEDQPTKLPTICKKATQICILARDPKREDWQTKLSKAEKKVGRYGR
ncbi:hypothetical protein ACLOJK_018338 [Asimina triloba]